MNIGNGEVLAMLFGRFVKEDPVQRVKSDVGRIARKLVDYTKKNRIEAVVFVDTSARLGATAFMAAWKIQHPNSRSMPKVLFLNPDGFMTKEFISGLEYEDLAHIFSKKKEDIEAGRLVVSKKDLATDEEVGNQLRDFCTKSGLTTESKILIFDTCSHSGHTFSALERAFNSLGMRNLKFGVASGHQCYKSEKLDLACLSRATASCLPFGPYAPLLVTRQTSGIHVAPNIRNRDLSTYAATRKFIKSGVADE